MSSLTDRLTVLAAVAQKPRRDFSIQWAGIAMVAALAAAPAYVAQTGFAQGLIARASSDLQVRELTGWRRSSTRWRLECISDYDPYWEARKIADRVESGARVYVGCPPSPLRERITVPRFCASRRGGMKRS